MIVITGAAGFIGSAMVAYLNEQGQFDLVLVDDFSQEEKKANYQNKKFRELLDRTKLENFLTQNKVDLIIHLGARTNTTEFDYSVFQKLNVDYSQMIWRHCCENSVPLIYASSAATYGNGNLGYVDDENQIEDLKPLNPYGKSKQVFDEWVLLQKQQPPLWAGLKFFNVYGPNEYHKGRMASVIFHTYNQVLKTGCMELFASNDPSYEDGMQLRDFVYVKDVVALCYWLSQQTDLRGIYNLGTGKARTFYDLAKLTQLAMDKEPCIRFKPMPDDLRATYQNFTEANMEKVRGLGYSKDFHSLEEGIQDYVQNYLIPKAYW